jgi:8-oxo-dGTP diphosphatase
MIVHSGGVIIVRMRGELQFLLIKQRDYKTGYWIFPKGKQMSGETEEETAVREVGLHVTLIPGFRKQITLIESGNFKKTVVFFIAKCDKKVRIVRDELSSYTWATVDEARKLITYPAVRDVLEEAYEYILGHDEFLK